MHARAEILNMCQRWVAKGKTQPLCLFGIFQRSLHEDDRICTDFVREFFARCRNYITSCQELKSDKIKALPVLGCLFSHYAELMLPLFNAKLREERFYYGSSAQYID